MCRTYEALGITPICRVPEPEPFRFEFVKIEDREKNTDKNFFRICSYIDGGAKGIVAPYIESVEQVKMLVGATKFRPLMGVALQRCLKALS